LPVRVEVQASVVPLCETDTTVQRERIEDMHASGVPENMTSLAPCQ
jgi:hypothetical protein